MKKTQSFYPIRPECGNKTRIRIQIPSKERMGSRISLPIEGKKGTEIRRRLTELEGLPGAEGMEV